MGCVVAFYWDLALFVGIAGRFGFVAGGSE